MGHGPGWSTLRSASATRKGLEGISQHLGCVRFGNIEERDGTVPRFSLVRVFGSCEERNQLVPQKGIFP